MLINVPYKNGDVVSIKLSSGEEMVARLENEEDGKTIVSNPTMLVASEGGMGMAPFMFTVPMSSKFPLASSNIICIVKTDEDTAKTYAEQTSGIALA